MKKILLLFTLVCSVSFSFAQFTPSEAANALMTDTDKKTFTDCQNDFDKAKSLIGQAEKIDKKYEKYNNTKKRKKHEKKTKEAKMLRTQAQMAKANAYTKMVDVLKSLVEAGTFYYPEDQELAMEYHAAAVKGVRKAGGYLKKYKDLKESKFKKIQYKNVLSDIENSEKTFKNALNGLEEALIILTEQESKKRTEDADKAAWAQAQSSNSLEGYQAYVNMNPSGMFVSEAKEQIALYEEAAAAQQEALEAVIYRVQILASKTAWPKEKIVGLYPTLGEEHIEESFEDMDGYYKYWVGEFKTYAEASTFRDQLKSSRTDVFVIAFKEGNKIDIIEARSTTGELEDEME